LPFVLWYLFAIAALLLAMRDFHPNSNRVRDESRYSLFQVSTKGGTSSAALGSHMANYSYYKKTIARWDARAKKIRG
jgi:hypothetical protein